MEHPKLNIHPPLINTPCPAATTFHDLLALWECPSTGAITTRTSLISGFPHDDDENLYIFYDSTSHAASSSTNPSPSQTTSTQNATLNTLGYSPLPLSTYLSYVSTIATSHSRLNTRPKTIIISVTGSSNDVADCYIRIARLQSKILRFSLQDQKVPVPLAMEINLSCPNIPHHPPPAYSREALTEYLESLTGAIQGAREKENLPRIPVGLKTPPYTYETQFLGLMEALEASSSAAEEGCPISFITATNTLGSCLAFADDGTVALPSDLGTGGLAGAPLHPLALGNVRTLRKMLDDREEKLGCRVQVIGVGGVMDTAGYRRMRMMGADVVGLASGLLLKGTEVFGEIERGLGKDGW